MKNLKLCCEFILFFRCLLYLTKNSVDMQGLIPVLWGFFILKWHSAPSEDAKMCWAWVCLRLGVHGCSVELKTFKFLQSCIQFSHVDWIYTNYVQMYIISSVIHNFHLYQKISIQMVWKCIPLQYNFGSLNVLQLSWNRIIFFDLFCSVPLHSNPSVSREYCCLYYFFFC